MTDLLTFENYMEYTTYGLRWHPKGARRSYTQQILKNREFLTKFEVDFGTWTILGRLRHSGKRDPLVLDDLDYFRTLKLEKCLEFNEDVLRIKNLIVTFKRGEVSGQRVNIRYILGTLHLNHTGEVIDELSELISQTIWRRGLCSKCGEAECDDCRRQRQHAIRITAIETSPETLVIYPSPLIYIPNHYRSLFVSPELHTPLRPRW